MTLKAVLACLALAAATPVSAQEMVVSPNGSRAVNPGPAANFTGAVIVEPLFAATEHTKASAGHVTFSPSARTAWHSHPAGQTLIITAGSGWVQTWEGERRRVGPGDVIWTPPGVKHWHGATPSTTLSHIAVQESRDGRNVDWLEQVSDAQYGE